MKINQYPPAPILKSSLLNNNTVEKLDHGNPAPIPHTHKEKYW